MSFHFEMQPTLEMKRHFFEFADSFFQGEHFLGNTLTAEVI